jgi:hypothetical protein
MTRLARFLGKSRADRRLLARAAVLQSVAAIAVRVLPFGRVQRLLASTAAIGPLPADLDQVDARVVQAVHAVARHLPGANCLTDALVAQSLLARYGRETTLCFGVARHRPDDRPFDAHAWLECGGATVIGARGIRYDPLQPPDRRCGPSPLPR